VADAVIGRKRENSGRGDAPGGRGFPGKALSTGAVFGRAGPIATLAQTGPEGRTSRTRSHRVQSADSRTHFQLQHAHLTERVAAGGFREDLYFRLNVISVEVPPLRERTVDLELLARHYLEHFARQCGRRLDGFSDQALARIRSYRWPGNLRELCNAVERAVILARGQSIAPEDLPAELQGAPGSPNGAAHSADEVKIGSLVSLDKLEEVHIRQILERTASLAQASGVLGIDQATLYRKRKRIGLG